MQNLPDIIELKHIRQTDSERCGNKSSLLGELLSRGFPIPDGFCLSINAYRQFKTDSILSSAFDTALRVESDRLFSTSQFLAVRSSATAEDLPGVSYAGVYKSVIGVFEPGDVGTAVQSVWNSYTSPSATAARKANKQADVSGGMGVLIQTVINAELAGVCYSLDPTQPLSDQIVISAGWGQGTGVVDGSIPADTLWLQRDDLAIVKRRIVEKDAYFTMEQGVGLVRKPVLGPKTRAACLSKDWARRIAQYALAVEQVFTRPQDLEWAIADGKIWILQSRPIASLGGHNVAKSYNFPVDWENPEQARQLWARTHFEHLGNKPFLPLDIDYVRLLESTRVETCLFMGADRNEEMKVINGQIYTCSVQMPISKIDLHVRQQAYRDLQQRLIHEGRTSWDYWGPEIELANERLFAVDTSCLDGPGLANFLEEVMAVRSRHNMLHPMMWFKPLQSYFDAFQEISGLSGSEAEIAAYRFLEGEESPLTRLIDRLYTLAIEAHGIPDVVNWMHKQANNPSSQNSNGFADFPYQAHGAAGWWSKFQEFLSEFGDRNGHGYGSEVLVTTPTWRDQPLLVISLATQFLEKSVETPWQQRERSRRVIEAEVDALCTQCSGQQIVENFMAQLRYARRSQAVVEIHNHHIEQVGLGQLRRAVLASANWLLSTGVLSITDDIFWLTFLEILAALRNSGRDHMDEVIQTRKKEYHEWEQYQPPPYLGLPSAKLPPRLNFNDDLTASILDTDKKISGLGVSSGVVSGRARVIKNRYLTPRIKPGDILVAENAGPLWLPFFPTLAGIVLEIGSLGQHAASTAREYGIPAVMSAANATLLIKDGDWITIDGMKGIVKLDSH